MKNQSGRSMVELIAIVAIMGILSAVATKMYQYTVIKYHANEIIHRANIGYSDIILHNDTDDWIELKNTMKEQGALEIIKKPLKGYMYNKHGFIMAENIDKEVCDRILDELTTFGVLSSENTPLTTCSKGGTDMIFDFGNVGAMEFSCESSADCTNGQVCSALTSSCMTPGNCGEDAPFWNTLTEECESCGTSNRYEPVWDASTKSCVECLSNSDCASKRMACDTANKTCDICASLTPNTPAWSLAQQKCVECTTGADCASNVCYQEQCIDCPEHASAYPTDEQLGETSCYCSSGYVASNDICVKDIAGKCTDGEIITANNGQKYCTITRYMSFDGTLSWCRERGLNLISKDALCSNKPVYGAICEDFKGLDLNVRFWLDTWYGNSGAPYYWLRYHMVNSKTGVISMDETVDAVGYPLCQ